MNPEQITLNNGLRVILDNLPDRRSVYLGVFVAVGSRFESAEQAGYSHFLEHMLFKGTAKRSYQEISRDIDKRGGYLNAYTDKEITAYYVEISSRNLFSGLEVLGDMLTSSTLPPDELETERKVILEEMLMVEDSPEELIFDLFFETAFGETSPLGRRIIGTEQTIQACNRDKLQEFYQSSYTPENLVLSLSGNLYSNAKELNELKQFLEDTFAFMQPTPAQHNSIIEKSEQNLPYGGQVEHFEKDTGQVHFILGLPGSSREQFSPEYAIFSQFLGGSSSSQLFLKLREQTGLCYSIASAEEKFAREGVFLVHGATATANFLPAIDLLMQTIHESVFDPSFETEIAEAKEGLLSSMDMLLESTRFRASYLARNLLYNRNLGTFEHLVQELENCPVEKVREKIKNDWQGTSFSFQSVGNLEKNEVKKQIGVRYPAAIF